MNNPLVSVIVPIYNTPKEYLYNSINSIITQCYNNLEVILVDDGSFDEIAKCCDEIATLDGRIQVMHKQNQGVSVARNVGTNVATGDYLMYVDSDDILFPNAISQGVENVTRFDADMVIGCVQRIATHDIVNQETIDGNVWKMTNKEFDLLRSVYFNSPSEEIRSRINCGYISRAPYAKLIKTSIAKKVLFPSGIPIGEDAIWNLRLLENLESILVDNNIWYGYFINGNSAIRKYYGNRDSAVSEYLNLIFSENNEFCKNNYKIFGRTIAKEFYCVLRFELMSKNCPMTKCEKNKYVHDMLRSGPWNHLLDNKIRRSLPLKYRMLLLFCSLNLWQLYFKTLK